MALLKLGGIVTAISGKVGGQCFVNSTYGPYLKNIGGYVNKITPKRKKANAFLCSISSLWQTLTVAQQNSWTALSPSLPYTNRVGDTAYYSGFNLFVQFNLNLLLVGKSPNLTAPPLSAGVPPTLFTLTDSSGDILIKTSNGDSGVLVKVYSCMRLSYGDSQYQKRKRLLTITANGNLLASYNMNSDYASVFGVSPAKGRIWVELETFDQTSGQPLGTFINEFIDMT